MWYLRYHISCIRMYCMSCLGLDVNLLHVIALQLTPWYMDSKELWILYHSQWWRRTKDGNNTLYDHMVRANVHMMFSASISHDVIVPWQSFVWTVIEVCEHMWVPRQKGKRSTLYTSFLEDSTSRDESAVHFACKVGSHIWTAPHSWHGSFDADTICCPSPGKGQVSKRGHSRPSDALSNHVELNVITENY